MTYRQVISNIQHASKKAGHRIVAMVTKLRAYPRIGAVINKLAMHKLAVAVGSCVILAIITTILNVAAYQASTVSDLDLSRPGFSRIRDQVRNDGSSTRSFNPNGPVDKAALDEFLGLYDTEADKLRNSSGFRGQVLSDEELRLSEQSQPADPVE